MRIRLTRSGGFIPLKKIAESDVDISEEQFIRLVDTIRRDPDSPRIKDAAYYTLSSENNSIPVDLSNVPEEFRELIEKLKDDLRTVK